MFESEDSTRPAIYRAVGLGPVEAGREENAGRAGPTGAARGAAARWPPRQYRKSPGEEVHVQQIHDRGPSTEAADK